MSKSIQQILREQAEDEAAKQSAPIEVDEGPPQMVTIVIPTKLAKEIDFTIMEKRNGVDIEVNPGDEDTEIDIVGTASQVERVQTLIDATLERIETGRF